MTLFQTHALLVLGAGIITADGSQMNHPKRSEYEERVLALSDETLYDEITWICSHNAMSNHAENWLMPNQLWSIPQQLEHGIHAQMWDIWMLKGEPYLRHGNGKLFDTGKKSLLAACKEVKHYLDEHPRAVITLILESKVDDNSILKALKDSGLESMRFSPPHQFQDWPSLGTLRKDNKRLIILCDRRTENFIQLWDHAVETDWVNRDAKLMNNKLRRGKPENPLLILNHFVGTPLPSRSASKIANSKAILEKRENDIDQLYQRRANFWTLDYIGCADALEYISKRLVHSKK